MEPPLSEKLNLDLLEFLFLHQTDPTTFQPYTKIFDRIFLRIEESSKFTQQGLNRKINQMVEKNYVISEMQQTDHAPRVKMVKRSLMGDTWVRKVYGWVAVEKITSPNREAIQITDLDGLKLKLKDIMLLLDVEQGISEPLALTKGLKKKYGISEHSGYYNIAKLEQLGYLESEGKEKVDKKIRLSELGKRILGDSRSWF